MLRLIQTFTVLLGLGLTGASAMAANGTAKITNYDESVVEVMISGQAAQILGEMMGVKDKGKGRSEVRGNAITCFSAEDTCHVRFDRLGVASPGDMSYSALPETSKVWATKEGKWTRVTVNRHVASTIFRLLDRSTYLPMGYSKAGPSLYCTSVLGESQCTFFVGPKGSVKARLKVKPVVIKPAPTGKGKATPAPGPTKLTPGKATPTKATPKPGPTL